MYVYVNPNWNIVLKSDKRVFSMFVKGCVEHIVEYKPTDRLIVEWWVVKLYEDSKQYVEDSNQYSLQKQLDIEKKKNAELESIANSKVRKELELDVKWQEANEYQRKIYMIRNMRWLQQ